ncbi:acyltransferase [Mangrovibacterium marinum]|uniref:Peptidoglycan/LPS O-acetylase OafA/YrhL n=1 Tax=Mangrovibacterium marinum TaxID=1639118 RepID=A0A2T5C1G2_9BACT|nr:acyltransferase [Mangrovibacterium marinum]PTN08501.1 peptidoglycan/LPS O-acetylase OafA/YrhL [Mangrovibacterium marinum]
MQLLRASGVGFTDSKKHYPILDGLRGVAAIIVVLFHILETFSGGDHAKQIINHGYLAVDFFFVLSGFVIGYAYDDRWGKMTLKDFFKRRLIRLHPLIIVGMLIGAAAFWFQESAGFPLIAETPLWKMVLVMCIGFTLVPVGPSLDIRGWAEMHPLNGPAWSLFFEYLGNILYALFIRRLSNTILAILVAIAGAALIHLAVTSPHGDVIGGWSVEPEQLRVGFTRLLYPFLAGLLLSRIVKPGQIKNAFSWASLVLIVFLAMPRVGTAEAVWMNGLFDSLTIILIFPLIVYLGASGELQTKLASQLSRFLGNISYPLYIIHYPFIYLYMAWIDRNQGEWGSSARTLMVAAAIAILLLTIGLAYMLFKFYDVPVRKWLSQKFMAKKQAA